MDCIVCPQLVDIRYENRSFASMNIKIVYDITAALIDSCSQIHHETQEIYADWHSTQYSSGKNPL